MRNLSINLFTIGESSDINTWSNIPYFFSKSLLRYGITVNRSNLVPADSVAYLLFRAMALVWTSFVRLFYNRSYSYPVFRSTINYFLMNRKIKKFSLRFAESDINVFLTYSFSSYRYSDIPVVHYCDQTYEQYLEYLGEKPSKRDRWFINVERRNLENAHLVLALNQSCRDFIEHNYHTKNVHYLRAGINVAVEEVAEPEKIIAGKQDSKNILFIGKDTRKQGLDILIKAFGIFNSENDDEYTLHLVGIRRDELAEGIDRVQCYGYLKKDDPSMRATYLRLLESARMFVFPMVPGPLPGVIREAHLTCTPVIISNTSNISERIKHQYNGILVDSFTPEAFAFHMNQLVKNRSLWMNLARNARRSIEDNTWDNTIEMLLELFSKCGIVKSSVL